MTNVTYVCKTTVRVQNHNATRPQFSNDNKITVQYNTLGLINIKR